MQETTRPYEETAASSAAKTDNDNNKNQLGYNGVDGSILQSGDDVFKARNLQSEAASVSSPFPEIYKPSGHHGLQLTKCN